MIKVLIIDDEPMQREGIVRLTPWGDFGAEVIGAAGSGMEGILLAREYRPDVLIVDIKMPGLSGLDVIARLREELEAEYIILSGYVRVCAAGDCTRRMCLSPEASRR